MIGIAREHMKTQQLHQVLNAVWSVVADANRYFAAEAPWALAKTDPKRQGTVLYVTAEVLRQVAILALPFMPSSAAKLLDLLAVPADERAFHVLEPGVRIKAGVTLPPPNPVFPRYVESESKGPATESVPSGNAGTSTDVSKADTKSDTLDYRKLEILVTKIQKQLAPKAEVLHNVRLDGRESGTKRQVDVLVKENVGQYEIKIIIDCKDYKTPVDVKGVEEFDGLLRDVGAQKGVLVCPKGFSDAAKKRAAGLQIDLYSPVDTDVHKWQARVTIPALCDFRSAAMSFGFSMSAPYPFRVPNDFYSSAMIYDGKGRELGTMLDAAMTKWNDGIFPTEPGEHKKLNVFETRTVYMDNGYDPPIRIPVDLTVSLLVERQLYYGQLPVPQVSGFLDQLSGKVITNAFTVGMLDPDEVEKTWLKVAKEADAPVRPVIRLTGLVGWYDP